MTAVINSSVDGLYTVLYCNVLYSTVLYCTVLYRTLDNSGHKCINKQAGGQDFRGPLWG